MLVSMTGFGLFVCPWGTKRLEVEMQSLNRKFLDVSISFPKELARFEVQVRNWIAECIRRGQVSVRISLREAKASYSFPEKHLIKGYCDALRQLAQFLDFDEREVTLPFVMSTFLPQALAIEDSEILPVLEKGVKGALKKLCSMRRTEGTILKKAVIHHLKMLEKIVGAVEKRVPFARDAAHKRLKNLLGDALLEGGTVDERFFQAAVTLIDRSDITEELTRLHSHCAQFKTAKEGRTLDFLAQEMGREINTIGSKSSDLEIVRFVISAKGELEKIKEQIQNIE